MSAASCWRGARRAGHRCERVFVTPAAFSALLWRVVAVGADEFHEGFYSLNDAEPRVAFDRFERGTALMPELQHIQGVQRIV